MLLTLMALGLLAWWSLPVASSAPNRIVPGDAVYAWQVAGPAMAVLASLPMALAGWVARQPDPGWRSLGLVLLALLGLPLWLVLCVHQLVDPQLPQARLGIGAGSWCTLFVLLLALLDLRTRQRWPAGLYIACLCVPLVVTALCLPLGLDRLALWQEYRGRADDFWLAVGEHLLLVGATVALSLALGAALALLMRRLPALQRAGFGVLNFMQTIPSLALFGLLLGPLAWAAQRFPWLDQLGISGIGWAPALVALVTYSLLPMVRNTFVALEGVDRGVIEAARGMGMSRGQMFWQVRLPLALPVLLEGVRITTVQAIGLTAVAALIGAGGLGRFIFQGLGQAAMDLVLLGALPILVMAMLADGVLGNLSRRLGRGVTR
ncbi:ABC transporter permease [Halomonas cupida]|uniref:ABC transporter permease n=1 Tax=Halomonas TaxID=2745 RepID=UPI003241F1FD